MAVSGRVFGTMLQNIIPQWLGGQSNVALQNNQSLTFNYQSSLNHQAGNVAFYPGNTTPYQGQLPLPMPPVLPPGVNTRNRFADLIHNIEDIQGYKGPYDDDIHAMLDMRPIRDNCKVKLTAFLCFMNCNGIDRHNIMPFIRYAESIGIIFK